MKRLILLIVCAACALSSYCQFRDDSPIMIGAEILIEPGQNPEDVDLWFRTLSENGMKVTRLRMFEDYMKDADGNWDFSLFDRAFRAGEKYGIKIMGNLFPATSFDDIGGFKFPRDEQHWTDIKEYIRAVVNHFKGYKSLFAWVPVNEPGLDLPWDEDYTKLHFEKWKHDNVQPVFTRGYKHFPFYEEKFVLYYHPWFLKMVTEEIQKYDSTHAIHLNPAGVFDQAEIYEFSKWRDFLTSIGGSAHAGWHFQYFNRGQYSLAMSANSEFLRSAGQQLPWFMTEIQGGNNTYSGGDPMCPTSDEIAQWLWTIVGSGGKGGMFWCLNPRKSGIEAGEWAMLDFQNYQSDRFAVAADIARCINANEKLFSHSKVHDSNISVLYSKESIWIENKLSSYVDRGKMEGRKKGGVMKSALGAFEALSQCGFNPNFGDINDFDFSKSDYSNSTIILSHQISIPSYHWEHLHSFVEKGGTLIVEGMTAYYDENAICILNDSFPLAKLFGGDISEYKLIDELFTADISGNSLDVHLWEGYIVPTTGKPLATRGDKVIALTNSYGRGKVIWQPSLVSLGCRMKSHYQPLAELLRSEIDKSARPSFSSYHEGVFMKTLASDDRLVTVIVSQNPDVQNIQLKGFESYRLSKVLYNNHGGKVDADGKVSISPNETVVAEWMRK